MPRTRFTVKLREHGDALAACIEKVLSELHSFHPEMGGTVAIDGSDLPAYANGRRYVKRGGPERKRFADPDASWGHRSSEFGRLKHEWAMLPLGYGGSSGSGCTWTSPSSPSSPARY